MEYVQFSLAGMEMTGAEGLKKIRAVMEEAIRHGGLHVVKGALLWDSYRDFEMAMYQSTKGEDKAAREQHITQLFHRQLSVPLLDMVYKPLDFLFHTIVLPASVGLFFLPRIEHGPSTTNGSNSLANPSRSSTSKPHTKRPSQIWRRFLR